jgi:hypothetical protein
MFAYIHMPGHSEFWYHGPDTEAACIKWADATGKPYTLISNAKAKKIKWQNGEPVFTNSNDSDRLTDPTSSAAALFDGGWRSTDKEQLILEYDLTPDQATILCRELERIEAVQ